MNKNYVKGRNAEYRTIRWLEAEGYQAFRTAGSHGPFDVIALRIDHIRFIQVKAGSLPCALDYEKLQGLKMRLTGISFEMWWWKNRARSPRVEVL